MGGLLPADMQALAVRSRPDVVIRGRRRAVHARCPSPRRPSPPWPSPAPTASPWGARKTVCGGGEEKPAIHWPAAGGPIPTCCGSESRGPAWSRSLTSNRPGRRNDSGSIAARAGALRPAVHLHASRACSSPARVPCAWPSSPYENGAGPRLRGESLVAPAGAAGAFRAGGTSGAPIPARVAERACSMNRVNPGLVAVPSPGGRASRGDRRRPPGHRGRRGPVLRRRPRQHSGGSPSLCACRRGRGAAASVLWSLVRRETGGDDGVVLFERRALPQRAKSRSPRDMVGSPPWPPSSATWQEEAPMIPLLARHPPTLLCAVGRGRRDPPDLPPRFDGVRAVVLRSNGGRPNLLRRLPALAGRAARGHGTRGGPSGARKGSRRSCWTGSSARG
jgi:hypothetical protein